MIPRIIFTFGLRLRLNLGTLAFESDILRFDRYMKKERAHRLSLFLMVENAGLEPVTSCV